MTGSAAPPLFPSRQPPYQDRRTMEAERINLISNQLVDLSNRVNELRGYL